MANTKMTYKAFYNEVIALVGADRPDLADFATNAIAVLDKRSAHRTGKAKEVANEFQSKILAVMTDPNHVYICSEVATATGLSKQRVTGVLGQMVKAGIVDIFDYTPTGKKKDTVKGYTLIVDEDDSPAEGEDAPESVPEDTSEVESENEDTPAEENESENED